MADKDKQNLIDKIFEAARKIPSTKLDSFLRQACSNDSEVRREVVRLLAVDRELQSDKNNLGNSALEGVVERAHQAANDVGSESRKMNVAAADRNLLFGIVALQMNFIDRDALVRAMNAWVLSKDNPIERILVSQGDLGENTNMLLTALVEKHLEYHDNDAEKSLAALSAVGSLKRELDEIADNDLHQSTAYLDSDNLPLIPETSTVAIGDSSKHAGRFRVLRPHRKGGLGAVSVAKDEELNREVALKEVREEFAHHKSARDRLRVEAEITGGLEHPGIVPVYGLGTYQDGNPFYCMRFIKGDSLKEAIKTFQESKGSLSASEHNLKLRNLLRRFIDVCDAVSYAHSRRVLHRDLKPGNIMLGKYGETLVVDWGLAKATAQNEDVSFDDDRPIVPRSGSTAAPTMAGSTIGTPEYMSPEQADGRIDQLGPATDVYSLGATLYCLLTGRPPFRDKDKTEILRQVRRGEFPRPTEINKTVPKALESICLKAMKKDPALRYPTPAALALDIERWLADEPVDAYPEPWTQRFARTIRKNRVVAMTLSAAVITAIAGLLVANAITQNKNAVIQTRNSEIKQQNEELFVLNQQLEETREKVNVNFKKYRKLTTNLIQKAEKELSQKQGMEDVRRWLTNKALSSLEEFQNGMPDDLEMKRELALFNVYAANIDRLFNDFDAASPKYESAISLLEQICKVDPENRRYTDQLAETFRDSAGIYSQSGRLDIASERYSSAIELVNALRIEFPNKLAYRRTAGVTQLDMADVQIELAKNELANELLTKSGENLEFLVNSHNPKPVDLPLLVMAITQKSRVLRVLGKLDKAETTARHAVELAEDARMDRKNRPVRHALAKAKLELSKVLLLEDANREEVANLLNEAILMWQEIKTEAPSYPFYQRYLANAYNRRAKAKIADGKLDDARRDLQEAQKIATSLLPKNELVASYQESLSDIFATFANLEKLDENEVASNRAHELAVERLEKAISFNPSSKRLSKKLIELKIQREE